MVNGGMFHGFGFSLLTCDRQEYPDHRPFAHRRVDPHQAVGLLGEAIDHRQAEARALPDRLGSEEGIEHLVQRIAIDADAGVRHPNHDIAARRNSGIARAALLIQFDLFA